MYVVTYRNEGKRIRTAPMTLEAAKKSAEFLKFQGATHIRITPV